MEPVQVERFYLGCLAHASYIVASEGVAAIIDPQRDVDIYLRRQRRNGWQIQHIIETRRHADFVSGHRELADRTGAQIYLGANSGAQFPHVAVNNYDEIRFGQCCLRFMHTPGHTLESISIVMTDLGDTPRGAAEVFTGDRLFVGDVGRPDLSPTHTPQQLAELLYQSNFTSSCSSLPRPDLAASIPPTAPAHSAAARWDQKASPLSASSGAPITPCTPAAATNSCCLLSDNLPAAPE